VLGAVQGSPVMMTRRVEIRALSAVPVQDPASGEDKTPFETVCTPWAERAPVTSRESFASQQRYAEAEYRYRTWRLPALQVTPKHQLYDQLDEVTYDILGVVDTQDRRFVDIVVKGRPETAVAS
jgi:head-tail adaptor